MNQQKQLTEGEKKKLLLINKIVCCIYILILNANDVVVLHSIRSLSIHSLLLCRAIIIKNKKQSSAFWSKISTWYSIHILLFSMDVVY